MSIIGPRPLLVSYLPWYTEEEKQRHDVRPGLSGLAQVNGRNSVTWEEKFSWDLKYVDRITFLGDVKITLDTVKKAFIKVEGVELNHEGRFVIREEVQWGFMNLQDVLYLMNRFTVCFGGVWRRIGRIQRGSLI